MSASDPAEWAAQLTARDVEGRLALLGEERPANGQDFAELCFVALGDENWRVRKTAVKGLLELGPNPELIKALIGRMGESEDPGLRNAASETLVGFGSASLPALDQALQSPNARTRLFAAVVLGQIGDPASVTHLVRSIDDPDENVRTAVIESLGCYRLPEAAEALTELLASGDLPTRFAAVESLANQGTAVPFERIAPLLKQKILRKAAFELLANTAAPEGLPSLLEGATDQARSCREAALRALEMTYAAHPEAVTATLRTLDEGAFDESAVARVGETLESEDQAVRRGAVRLLCGLPYPVVLDHILPLTRDEGVHDALREALLYLNRRLIDVLLERFSGLEPNHQALAALAFGKVGERAALPLLRAGIHSDNGRLIRTATEALGELQDVEATEDLVSELGHPYPDVRDAAATALERIASVAPEVVLAAIEPAVRAADPIMRTHATQVLGSLGEFLRTEELLELVLGDESPRVRAAAAESLGRTASAGAAGALARAMADEDPQVRRAAAFALGSFSGDAALEALRVGLSDAELWVRCEAIRSLGRTKSSQALQELEGLLSADALHPLIGARALEALEEADPERAVIQARALLNASEAEVVQAALDVLSRNPSTARSVDTSGLAGLLAHESWAVRLRAAQVLGRRPDEAARAAISGRLAVERDTLVQQALRQSLERTDLA